MGSFAGSHARIWLSTICGVLLSFVPPIASESCPISPLAVQLRNCTFSSGVESWGNLLEIGSPPQRVCLVPSTVVNSTLVSQNTLCTKSGTARVNQCESIRGGFFNENSSSTWTEAPLSSYNDTRLNPTWTHFNYPGITKAGFDIINFPGTDGSTFYGAGIALNQFGNNSNAGMLGLGKDSVFLEDAVHQNKSPSKSWSLDSGSLSIQKPRNGELVIGGYNKARLDGSFRWSKVSDMAGDRPCPLRTTIKKLDVLLPDGTSFPLKSSAEDISACIEPYDNLFRFTSGMLLNWKQVTKFNETLMDVYSRPLPQNLSFTELGLPYTRETALEWSLSITLDSGYTMTLPHYEMQKPLYGWNSQGEKEEVPGITNIAILSEPTGEGEVPTLGKIFLSRSYLAVDYHANQFGLAEVLTNPTGSELVPFSCGSDNKANATRIETPSSSKTPVGAIVGGVLGGVAVLVLLALALWWFLRKRKASKQGQISEMSAHTVFEKEAQPSHRGETQSPLSVESQVTPQSGPRPDFLMSRQYSHELSS